MSLPGFRNEKASISDIGLDGFQQHAENNAF